MATSDMDQNQAETFLVSQTKKRDGGITEPQSKVLLQCWKSHRSRVHETVLRSCVWNNRLRNINWRIDVKSRSRSVEQPNTATAVVELELESSDLTAQVWECLSVLTGIGSVKIVSVQVIFSGLASLQIALSIKK